MFLLRTASVAGFFLICNGLVAQPSRQRYEPIEALARGANLSQLEATDQTRIYFSWNGTKTVDIKVYHRASASNPWGTPQNKTETTSFYVSAVGPSYYNALYVCGVYGTAANPMTTIEKWSVLVPATPSGQFGIAINKQLVLSSASYTHLEACAVDPNEDFLLAKHHESGEVWRIALPSGSVTTIASPTSYPNLWNYNFMKWEFHSQQGHVFRLINNKSGYDLPLGQTLLLWDSNLDGNPDTIEEIDDAEAEARGYFDSSRWLPDSRFHAHFE